MPAQTPQKPPAPPETSPTKRKRSRPAAVSPLSAADVSAPAPGVVSAPSVPAPADDGIIDVTASGSVDTVPEETAPKVCHGSTDAELKKHASDLKQFLEEQNAPGAPDLPQAI